MVDFNLAHTEPINPPSATSVLTIDQVWAGLQLKIRDAPAFVGAIATCKVLEDKDGVVTREVTFKAEPEKVVKEVCRSYWPLKVDFHQTDGSLVSNIISDYGSSGADKDLYMTYTFQWLNRDVAKGSEDEAKLLKQYRNTAVMAVSKSIESIRKLVSEGKLQ